MEKISFKKIKNYELNEAFLRIMYWFFSYPLTPITLSELAKETKVSKKTATTIVSAFLKEGFLEKEEIGRSWRLICNQKHYFNYTKKIVYNLSLVYSLLYEQGLIHKIYEIVGNPKAIILFGSYRKGDDTEKSDLDLAIEIFGEKEPELINLGVIEEFGFRKKVPLNLYIFSRKNINTNFLSNIINGIVVEGFLEAV